MASTLVSSLAAAAAAGGGDGGSAPRLKSSKKRSKIIVSRPQHDDNHDHHLVYPKSTPTALTCDEALDGVLADVQSTLARGAALDPSILSSLLETCCRDRLLCHGRRLHRLIPTSLLRRYPALSSKLLRLYASCGLIDDAHNLFDQMPHRSRAAAFTWNSLISGYAELGLFEDAMALYFQMEEESVEPDLFTFPRVLKACAGLGSIRQGEAVHRHAVRAGLSSDVFVLNSLVDMYAKCGDIVRARKIFDRIPDRDEVSWNSMLTGYIRHGLLLEALNTCRDMLQEGIEPDSVTISSLLAGFSSAGKLGLEIHCWVLRRGLELSPSVANSLIRMYSDRNQLRRARAIFESMQDKDLVSWNALISAYSRYQRVLDMFQRMVDSGMLPDKVTFVSLISACANLGLVEDGRRLFDEMPEKYGIMPGLEHYGCMVNLLGRAGLIDEAYEIVSKQMPFEGGPTVWGALLYACTLHGNASIGEVAAERLFELEPDNEHNFELMARIYINAGRLEDAEEVLRMMRERGLEFIVSKSL